jgi:hypothetical protein
MRDREHLADISRCVPLAPLHSASGRFYEWKAIKGQRAKQPYAIAMKDGSPFGIAGLWENWKDPASGEWTRTFAVITTDANDWWPKSMTGCQQYWHPRTTRDGSVTSLTPAI